LLSPNFMNQSPTGKKRKSLQSYTSTHVGSANRIFSFYSTLKSQQIFCKYLTELVCSFTTNLYLKT
jgi:hypothetical protein